jgi:hypothetical protein
MKWVLLVIITGCSVLLSAQEKSKPCDSSESSQFDFWIGDWDCEWTNQDGSINHGSNSISKILGGCVIEENFNGNPGIGLIGKSHSVYSPVYGVWLQTWVDNNGAYLAFEGGMKEDKMILSRTVEKKDGSSFLQRMIWYNISANGFDWNWERSDDDGKTWKTNWQLHYTRKN